MGILSTGVDYYMVYRFIKALVTPFNKTKAFDLGIVDDEGNILKKHRELKTAELYVRHLMSREHFEHGKVVATNVRHARAIPATRFGAIGRVAQVHLAFV